MKLGDRYYFDVNATAPLCSKVRGWLSTGELYYGNPSSVHASGKKSRRAMNSTKEFLYEVFNLDEAAFRLFFHSGASEGINTLLKGFATKAMSDGETIDFFYLATDHSCVNNLAQCLEDYGHKTHSVSVDSDGNFDDSKLISQMNTCTGKVLFNFTWVNNETGVVFPLELAEKIKSETGCFLHVDAVQAVGKIENWKRLSSKLDAYSFSSHKFGAMKGTGFSFVREEFDFHPFIRGGGQQDGMRSGTENTNGIYSIKLALEDILENYDYHSQLEAKNYIENELVSLLGDQGEIVGVNNENRNANTIYFILYNTKAHTSSMAFDLAKIDVSNGSACSSGAVLPSRVLLAMGYNEDYSKSSVRLSFSAFLNLEEAKEYSTKINTIVRRFVES